MSTTDFYVKQIDWNSSEAEHVRRIRFAVFVDEQNVPAELELDDIDEIAVHVLAFNPAGNACGTGRLFNKSADDPKEGTIGRMAVLPHARGTGCGAAILQELISAATARGFRQVVLSAQTHAVPFYAKYGFSQEGGIYQDAGIPHVKMRREL